MKKRGILVLLTCALSCFAAMPALAEWKQENNTWRYYSDEGTLVTGWLEEDENWYYLKDSGDMATGWLEYEDNKYYLYDSGNMATGWLKLDGYWHYFHNDGPMAYDTWIDNYYVNTKGQWVKSK